MVKYFTEIKYQNEKDPVMHGGNNYHYFFICFLLLLSCTAGSV